MKRNICTSVLVCIILVIIISGCANWGDTSSCGCSASDNNYSPALVTTADSFKTHGGNRRIEIPWLLQSESNVYNCKVSRVKGGFPLK